MTHRIYVQRLNDETVTPGPLVVDDDFVDLADYDEIVLFVRAYRETSDDDSERYAASSFTGDLTDGFYAAFDIPGADLPTLGTFAYEVVAEPDAPGRQTLDGGYLHVLAANPSPPSSSSAANAFGLAAHLHDEADAHDASAVSFAPVGSVAATDVQAAVAEVAVDAAALVTAEATTRATADTTEATARAAADTANAAAITAEASARATADALLLSLTPTAVKTANYTAAAGELVPVDTSAGSVTVTLPTAPTNGTLVAVSHSVQGVGFTVTVARGGTDRFDSATGATSKTLPMVKETALWLYRSGVWYPLTSRMMADQFYLNGYMTRTTGLNGVLAWQRDQQFPADGGSRLYVLPTRGVLHVTTGVGATLKLFADHFINDDGSTDFDYRDLGIYFSADQQGDLGYHGNGVWWLNSKSGLTGVYEHLNADIGIGMQDGQEVWGRWVLVTTPGTERVVLIVSRNPVTAGAGNLICEQTTLTAIELVDTEIAFNVSQAGKGGLRWSYTGGLGRNLLRLDPTRAQLSIDTVQTLNAREGGSVAIGPAAALATTATDGFLELPSMAGVPTGTPTPDTGKVPLVWDTLRHKLLGYSGGAWVRADKKIVASSLSSTGVDNTNAETTLTALAAPAGLQAANCLRLRAGGDCLNSTGGTVVFTLRFKVGATTVATMTVSVPTAATGRRKWWTEVDIDLVSTSSEVVTGPFILSASGTNEGMSGTTVAGAWSATGAVDMTTPPTITLTAQSDTTSDSAEFVCKSAKLTLV